MPRRRARRITTEEGAGGLVVLLVLAAYGALRGAESLSVPWRIAALMLIISIVGVGAWAVLAYLQRQHARRLVEAELLALTPDQFEERVKLLLADLGWTQLERRGGRGDRGVDLVGTYQGHRYVVQCKRYSRKVTPAQVRELVGAMQIQKADRALLVTTSGYTAQGYEEAREQRVELWDGASLSEQITRADALRSDPARVQAVRQRTAALLGAIAMANGLAVVYALSADKLLPADVQPVAMVSTSIPTLIVVPPTAAPVAASAGDEAAELVPLLSASVISNGALSVAPDAQSASLGSISAGELVSLLGRSADGLWLQVVDARGTTGWVQRNLIQLDPHSEAQLQIVTP